MARLESLTRSSARNHDTFTAKLEHSTTHAVLQWGIAVTALVLLAAGGRRYCETRPPGRGLIGRRGVFGVSVAKGSLSASGVVTLTAAHYPSKQQLP